MKATDIKIGRRYWVNIFQHSNDTAWAETVIGKTEDGRWIVGDEPGRHMVTDSQILGPITWESCFSMTLSHPLFQALSIAVGVLVIVGTVVIGCNLIARALHV